MRQPAPLPADPLHRSLLLGGRSVPYRLRRSARSRGLRITIDDRDGLVVSVPLASRRGWVHPEPQIDAEKILGAWLRERATELIAESVARHAAVLGVAPARVDVRDPRSRWGSASRRGRLMFSWRLVLAPPDSLETVVVHELAHLKVFGHGPRFWALVASRRPGHLADRAWLRRNSQLLHAALEAWPEEVATEASGGAESGA